MTHTNTHNWCVDTLFERQMAEDALRQTIDDLDYTRQGTEQHRQAMRAVHDTRHRLHTARRQEAAAQAAHQIARHARRRPVG